MVWCGQDHLGLWSGSSNLKCVWGAFILGTDHWQWLFARFLKIPQKIGVNPWKYWLVWGCGVWIQPSCIVLLTQARRLNIWHLPASLSLNNKMFGVLLRGELCKCLYSVCFPPICLSVCCLLVTVGLAAQQSASSQTFADHESMAIHIIPSSLPLQPLPVSSLLCGTKKFSLCLEVLQKFCRRHLHNLATSMPSLSALSCSVTFYIHSH